MKRVWLISGAEKQTKQKTKVLAAIDADSADVYKILTSLTNSSSKAVKLKC